MWVHIMMTGRPALKGYTRMTKTDRSKITALLAIIALTASFCLSRSLRIASADVQLHYPLLSRYATDLTALAQQGKLERTSGHGAEIRRILNSLSENTRQHPVLIGNSLTLDTDAVVRGVAQRIARGNIREELLDKHIFALNLDRLSAGTKDGAEFVAR